MECLGVELRDLQRGLALFARLGQYFILATLDRLLAHTTDIGDIFDVQYLKATILEVAAHPVGHGKGAQVANVDVPGEDGVTRIHLDFARFYRNNHFNASIYRIIYSNDA